MRKITRKQYLDMECTHREYYAQFVTPHTMGVVVDFIGADKIMNSTDEHMNDIPLAKWDRLHGIIPKCNSISDTVCTAKEAAKQFKEANK